MTTVAQEVPLGRRTAAVGGPALRADPPNRRYLVLFFAWPMVQAFELAFRDGRRVDARAVPDDGQRRDFEEAFKFTLLLVVVIVPLQFVLALGDGAARQLEAHGRGVFLSIFILPLAISDLAAGLVWPSIFTERGYLNTVLEAARVIDQPYIWLDPTKPSLLLMTVVVAEVWRSTAFVMVILLAGLQGIPKEYRGGRGLRRRLLAARAHVTLPLLKPSLQVALLFRIILAFEVFAVVIAITGPAQDDARRRGVALAGGVRQQPRRGRVLVADPRPLARLRRVVLWLLRTPKEQMLR